MRPGTWPYRFRSRLRSLFRRRQVERDLDDEIAFHLAMQAQANRRAGMEDSEAQRAAQLQFGAITQEKEACRDHIFGWIDGFYQDTRYAVRSLRRSPRFALLLISTLAFGIGANVTVFSMVHGALLESLPFADSNRLFVMAGTGSLSVPAYEFYATSEGIFSGVAAWVDESMTLVGAQTAERLHGGRATASFFPLLGVKPLLGRSFLAEEDRPGGAPVAMLAHDTWRKRFGGAPDIVGQTIRVNAADLTVIGVLPPSFWFPGEPIEVWVPRVFDNHFVSPQMVRNGAGILSGILVKLRPEVSPRQASAAVRDLSARVDDLRTVHLEPMQESATAEIRPALLLLWGAAGCILLVTCTNTAGLLLARATARRKEIAVRLTLGVSRNRLARQMLTESLAFASLGGLAGCVLARGCLAVVAHVAGHDVTGWRQLEIGGPEIIFAVGASALSAIVFGLAPVVQSLRSDPHQSLRDSGRGESSGSQSRLLGLLVSAQTGLAVALAISAALLLQSYARMRTVPPGVRTDGLVTASVHLSDTRYSTATDRVRFYDELLRRIRGMPGISLAAATSALHLQSRGEGSMTWPEGAEVDPAHPPVVKNRNVSPEYFPVLGIPVIAGRGFSRADTASSEKVMLVNESFARIYFPGQQALGHRVTYTSEHATARIVGIVADVRPRMIDAAAQPEMYFPYMQRPRHEMTIVVRTSLPPATVERAMRNELRSVDPEQALYDVETMREVVSSVLSRPRSTSAMVAFFSVAALLLAAIGIYGVLSFAVSRRNREIGVRLALGAQPSRIRAMVLAQSLKVVVAGIAIGVPVSFALARLFSTQLLGVKPNDPLTFGVVILVVLAVGWLAAFLPARRAARLDPMRTLQAE